MNTALSFLISFTITYLSTPLFRRLAVRLRILDLPNRRKVHKRATPLLGGVAIYAGLVGGLLFNLRHIVYLHSFIPAAIALSVILTLGLVDDVKGLSAHLRLFIEVIVALIIALSGVRVTFLPGILWGDIAEIVITVIWIVGVMNAYNYLDGLDGLAVGSAVINLLCFAWILFKTSQYAVFVLAVVLMGGSLGFLPYNFKKAKIFLGDAGSTLLGFSLAYIALVGYWAEDNIVKLSVPILILGVPIFDMLFTSIMRIKEARVKTFLQWLRYGGKDHFHHYLVDVGLRPQGAVVFIYFISLSLGISAIMISNHHPLEAFLSLMQACIIFGVIAALIVVGKRHRSGWRRE